MATLEERVERLEVVEEIKRLQARYAHALDNEFDADALIALFLPSGAFDGRATGGSRTVGRPALHAMWSTAAESFKWAFHYMISPDIEVATGGATARGSWYLLEAALLTDGVDGRSEWQGSTYDISYALVDGVWYFDEMRIIGRFTSRNEAGWRVLTEAIATDG